MDYKLTSLSAVLERADNRLRSPDGRARLWPTGFPLLDDAIGGGLRSGTLNLIAGPQGQGKTMFALQAARAAVKTGRSAVFFSYELEADATAVTEEDIDGLRALGLPDAEILGVVLAAAARCFFSKTLDGLGVRPDRQFAAMEPALRDALTIGRPIAEA